MIDIGDAYCGQCGTRYTFESGQAKAVSGNARLLVKAARNFVMRDGSSFGDAMRAARQEVESSIATQYSEEFYATFNFCMSCRKYTCKNCWNDAAGACVNCSPVEPGGEPARAHDVDAASERIRVVTLERPDILGWPAVESPADLLMRDAEAKASEPEADHEPRLGFESTVALESPADLLMRDAEAKPSEPEAAHEPTLGFESASAAEPATVDRAAQPARATESTTEIEPSLESAAGIESSAVLEPPVEPAPRIESTAVLELPVEPAPRIESTVVVEPPVESAAVATSAVATEPGGGVQSLATVEPPSGVEPMMAAGLPVEPAVQPADSVETDSRPSDGVAIAETRDVMDNSTVRPGRVELIGAEPLVPGMPAFVVDVAPAGSPETGTETDRRQGRRHTGRRRAAGPDESRADSSTAAPNPAAVPRATLSVGPQSLTPPAPSAPSGPPELWANRPTLPWLAAQADPLADSGFLTVSEASRPAPELLGAQPRPESYRQLANRPSSPKGVCGKCAFPLSANVRFCRRCGAAYDPGALAAGSSPPA